MDKKPETVGVPQTGFSGMRTPGESREAALKMPPQTGYSKKIPMEELDEMRGADLFKKETDMDLRAWIAFSETPIYAFIMKTYEKKIRELGERAVTTFDYKENKPLPSALLAHDTGYVRGLRSLSELFRRAKHELERRRQLKSDAAQSDADQ